MSNNTISFSIILSKKDNDRMKQWMNEQDRLVAIKQNKSTPNYGCSGGAYRYSFIPTNLGTIFKLTNDITSNSIDLSDYDNW